MILLCEFIHVLVPELPPRARTLRALWRTVSVNANQLTEVGSLRRDDSLRRHTYIHLYTHCLFLTDLTSTLTEIVVTTVGRAVPALSALYDLQLRGKE